MCKAFKFSVINLSHTDVISWQDSWQHKRAQNTEVNLLVTNYFHISHFRLAVFDSVK